MSEENTMLDAIQQAKREAIERGVSGVSSAGRSVSYTDVKTLEELERAEKYKKARSMFARKCQAKPYDSQW